MNKKLIIGSIIGGIGLIGITTYLYIKKQIQLISQFEWNILDLDLTKLSLTNLTGKIKFRFYNKSDIEITVQEFYLDLYFNSEYIGWLRDDGEFVIPANGYNDIEFEFTINPQYIIKNIVDIIYIATKQKDANFGLDGYAKLKSGFINYVVPITCDCSTKNVDCNCK